MVEEEHKAPADMEDESGRSRAIARCEIAALGDHGDYDYDHDHDRGNNDNHRRHVEFAVARSSKRHLRAHDDCAEKGERARKESRRRPREGTPEEAVCDAN